MGWVIVAYAWHTRVRPLVRSFGHCLVDGPPDHVAHQAANSGRKRPFEALAPKICIDCELPEPLRQLSHPWLDDSRNWRTRTISREAFDATSGSQISLLICASALRA